MSHSGHQSLQGDGSPVTHSDNGLDYAHFIISPPLSVLVPHLRIWRLIFSSLPNKLLALEIVSLPPLWGGVCFWELPIDTVPSASDPVDPSVIYVCQRSCHFYSIFLSLSPNPTPTLDPHMDGKPQNDLAVVSFKQKGNGLDKA